MGPGYQRRFFDILLYAESCGCMQVTVYADSHHLDIVLTLVTVRRTDKPTYNRDSMARGAFCYYSTIVVFGSCKSFFLRKSES